MQKASPNKISLEDAEIKHDSLQRSMQYVKEVSAQTQEKLNSFISKSENLER